LGAEDGRFGGSYEKKQNSAAINDRARYILVIGI